MCPTGNVEEGVSQYYVLLELCEQYKMSPLEFDELPDEIKYQMIAKRELDNDYKRRQQEKQNNK